MNPYHSQFSDEYADVMLPLAPFTEMPGTYINAEGRWQTVQAACMPQGQARPGWKIIRVLGNTFNLEGFDYSDNTEVLEEMRNLSATVKNRDLLTGWRLPHITKADHRHLWRIANFPIYRGDPIVRRSAPLQKTLSKEIAAVRINRKLAEQLQLHQGDWVTVRQDASEVVLPLIIDESISDNAVALAAAIEATAHFGEVFGNIELRKA
jgi:NADH-quinone oxidoreductase subunit G